MAVIKAVSSHASIGKAINYIIDFEKTKLELVGGINCSPLSAINEMKTTKEIYGKTDGRTYKHFVQSFHADEKITANEAFELAKEFAEKCPLFKGFEVVFATHTDKDHIHTHFIVNSVSCEDGHKFQMTSSDLKNMKELSDNLCRENELTVTEKGKTFEGEIREETVSYVKDTYNRLKQAEQGNVKSFVFDIALKVLEEKESATSKEEFVESLKQRGVGVDWQDKHKYITFTDLERQEAGEKQCKVRDNKLEKYFNIDFSKEGLSSEFTRNLYREKDRENGSERANANVNREQSFGVREQFTERIVDSTTGRITKDSDRLYPIDKQVRSIAEGVSLLNARHSEGMEGLQPTGGEDNSSDIRGDERYSETFPGTGKDTERGSEFSL